MARRYRLDCHRRPEVLLVAKTREQQQVGKEAVAVAAAEMMPREIMRLILLLLR
jgi:hypothetical protein